MMQHTDQNTQLLGLIEPLKITEYSLTTSIDNKTIHQNFKKREVLIGSHPDCDFIIEHPSVSRFHAKIEAQPNGYKLSDLNSKNGTFINDIKIIEIILPTELTLKLGKITLTFKLGLNCIELPISTKTQFGNIIGSSIAMREIFGLLEKISPTPATVLVEGESGTGKELIAEAIHLHSPRKDKPFVIFDCSAVSKDLIESELFGHIKGAFTGAVSDRKGAFLQANTGTIFLDEIGELSLDLQPKLLRVLEKQEIKPLGSEKTVKIDVRIIAATNRSLKNEVELANFREDLYYRLNVLHLILPPLRKRAEDIPILVEHFLNIYAQKFNKPTIQIAFSTIQKLKSYPWPGNVRELKNFVERAALLSSDNRIETKFLQVQTPVDSLHTQAQNNEYINTEEYVENALANEKNFKEAKQHLIEKFELLYWSKLLEKTNGNISMAARIADMHRKSVEYIMKKLDLSRNDFN